MDFTIRKGRRDDAPFLSGTVLRAIGDEMATGMAGSAERLPLVRQLFTDLAAMDHSQYSYLNALVAETAEGQRAGALIFYDGAELASLRRAFIEAANRLLGWGITEEDFTDETSTDEIYLDSLMVLPDYRQQGLATMLISEAARRAQQAAKPLGLLVDDDNPRARSLYEHLGFLKVGRRPFAGRMMDHLQLPL